jgi:hypothetical protein
VLENERLHSLIPASRCYVQSRYDGDEIPRSNVGNVGAALTTWEAFLRLPDAENGTHYELHNGEVVVVPPPKPNYIYIQSLLVEWLTSTAQGRGCAASEFPYRPAPNLQFWYANVI